LRVEAAVVILQEMDILELQLMGVSLVVLALMQAQIQVEAAAVLQVLGVQVS